jgi:hypothetical protein
VATSTTVTSSLNPSVYAQSVTFTATVSPSNGLGTVSFTADGTTIAGCAAVALAAVGTAEQASCTTATLSAGTHVIVAAYGGDGVHQSSSGTLSGGQVVTRAPTTTSVTTSVNPVVFGNTVTFTATVSPDDAGGTVAFSADGSATPIAGCGAVALTASGANAVATCTTGSLAGGTHTVMAAYSGDLDYQPSSGTLAGGQTVVVATALTETATAVLKSITTLSTTFSATLTTLPGNAPLAGQTIVFKVGASTECSAVTNALGVATCTVNVLGVVSVIVGLGSSASYAGTAVYLPSHATSGIAIGPITLQPIL